MSDDIIKQWDEYVESMGSVTGEVEHIAQKMRDRIEQLEREREVDHANINLKADFIDKTLNQLAEAELKLVNAMEALRFYANEDNYKGYSSTDPCGCCSSWYEPKINIDGEDSGGVARTVLAELEGKE
jgi:hypothetical protein